MHEGVERADRGRLGRLSTLSLRAGTGHIRVLRWLLAAVGQPVRLAQRSSGCPRRSGPDAGPGSVRRGPAGRHRPPLEAVLGSCTMGWSHLERSDRQKWPPSRPNRTLRSVVAESGERGAGMGSRVELFESIRRDVRLEGTSIRALTRKHQVRRRTGPVGAGQWCPAQRRQPERPSLLLDAGTGPIGRLAVAAQRPTERPFPSGPEIRRILASIGSIRKLGSGA